jgi:hypothetical protein
MDRDVERLMRWDMAGGVPSEDQVRLMLSQPRFADAARAVAANMLAVAAADRALDMLFKDVGRYLAALWAMYLDATGGLTLARLKAVCVTSGALSPGRAEAMLSTLRYLGFVELPPNHEACAGAHYVLTARFTDAWRVYLGAALEAASLIEPAVTHLLAHIDSPEVWSTLVRRQGEGYVQTTRDADQGATFVRVFLHHHAGTQIVHALVTAPADGAFPARDALRLSIAATARRFGVSRINVRRILDDAALEGYLRFREDGAIQFEPKGRVILQFYYCSQLIRLLGVAGGTLRDHPDLADQG